QDRPGAQSGFDRDAGAGARQRRVEDVAKRLEAGRIAEVGIAPALDEKIAGTTDFNGESDARRKIARYLRLIEYVAAGDDAGDVGCIVVLPEQRQIFDVATGKHFRCPGDVLVRRIEVEDRRRSLGGSSRILFGNTTLV